MIIGLNFNKFLIEKNQIKEKLKINKVDTKTDLVSVEEEKIAVKDKKAIRAKFSFNINYEPHLAKITLDGAILYLGESKEIEELLESWKNQKFPQKTKLEILNYALMKCNLKALSLEEEFNLPPHIPMPKLLQKSSSKEESKTKTDDTG